MSRPREEFLFFGEPGQRLFGVLHAPPAGNDRNAGWVLCSAFGEEHDGAQRNMVEWARFLSDQGFWVFRFDYRGSGNSEGISQVFTFDDNVADIRAALREMEHRSAVPCCGMCGLRLGGALAVMAALQEGREMQLVLWEPVVSGEQYTDELFRMAITTMMMQKGSAPLTRGQLRATLAAGGHTAVRGHIVNEAVYSSLARVDLLKAGRPGKSPVLIVQISNRPQAQMKPALGALYNAYAPGGPTTLASACIPLPWSLTNKEYVVRPPELFEPTRQWIVDHAAGRPADSPPSCAGRDQDTGNGERGLSNGSFIERPVEFPVEGTRARGVLHIPKNPSATKPVIILPVMSALFQVKLARELGQHGWTSLRFDPRGKGDSEGDLEFNLIAKLHFAVQNGLLRPDVGAAADFLGRELGAKRAIIIGICGDAITAVYQAAIDKRVVGIAPLELPMLYTPQVTDSAVARQVSQVRRFVEKAPLLNRVLANAQVRKYLRAWRSRWRKWAYALRHSLSPEPNKLLASFKSELGDWANVNLVSALIKCLERPIPMLCVFGGQRASGLSDFERIMPALRRVSEPGAGQISFHVVEGADHHFSVPEYTVQVFEIIVKWLKSPHQPWADEPIAEPVPAQLEKWDASLFPVSSVASIEPPEIGKRPNFSEQGKKPTRRPRLYRAALGAVAVGLTLGVAAYVVHVTSKDGENGMATKLGKGMNIVANRADKLRFKVRRLFPQERAGAGLVFLHHSCGQDWLVRGLDAALRAKDYTGTCRDITYGTDAAPDTGRPDSLRRSGPPGDYTNMDHWLLWFNDYLNGIKTFGRKQGINHIILFKSCFPMSNVASDGSEPADPFSDRQTPANYKAVFRHPGGLESTFTHNGSTYKPLEQVFGENPDVLFVAITFPPRHFAPQDATNDDEARRARAFCNWLKTEWLPGYRARTGLNNVAIFDWFDVLACPDNDPSHPNRLKAEYGGTQGDSHPNRRADKDSVKLFATAPGNFLDPAWTAFNAAPATAPGRS